MDTAIGGKAHVESLPRGTVTFMLTDVEGSTRRWQQDPEAMKVAMARHDEILTGVIAGRGGSVLKQRGEGDSVFAVFARASDAVAAARDIQRALDSETWAGVEPILIRIAIHSGEAHEEMEGDYRGPVVNRCARIRALANGGDVLLSSPVRELLQDRMPEDIALRDIGLHRLRDLDRPEHIYRVVDRQRQAKPARPRGIRMQRYQLLGAGAAFAGALAVLLAVILIDRPAILQTAQSQARMPVAIATTDDPTGVAVDAFGDVYVVEGQRIEKLARNSKLTPFAGSGAVGFGGDSEQALLAKLNLIEATSAFATANGITADSHGNVFFSDGYNQRIRRVGLEGIISTVAGSGSGAGAYGGDGGLAIAAELSSPHGVAIDSFGNLYIADTGNNRIRAVNLNDGTITTVAGTAVAGNLGDGGPATEAQLNAPQGVAIDLAGNLYIADTGNNRIRKIDPSTGVITTIAGTGAPGSGGNGGKAASASLNGPTSVAVGSNGLIYVADTQNDEVRVIDLSGNITVIAGGLDRPVSVAVDPASGVVYIADTGHRRLEEVR